LTIPASATSPPSSTPSPSANHQAVLGAIVGAVGGTLLLLFAIGVVCLFRRRNRNRQQRTVREQVPLIITPFVESRPGVGGSQMMVQSQLAPTLVSKRSDYTVGSSEASSSALHAVSTSHLPIPPMPSPSSHSTHGAAGGEITVIDDLPDVAPPAYTEATSSSSRSDGGATSKPGRR